MKKILDLVYSSRTTVLLLLIMAIAMGSATIIEEKYDTETAKLMVYNAKWFELLMLLLALNFIGNIKKHNLLSREKFSGFLFHFAFIVIIIGAGVTRYTGYNGTMHIRQGESEHVIYSSDPYLRIAAADNGGNYNYDIPVHLSRITHNSMHKSFETKSAGKVEIDFKNIIRNATDTLIENAEGGKSILAIVTPGKGGRETIYINEGELKDFGNFAIAFNNDSAGPEAIRINEKDGKLVIRSPFDIKRTAMPAMTIDTIRKDSATDFRVKCLHETPAGLFVCAGYYKKAKKIMIEGRGEDKGIEALVLDVTQNGKKQEVQIIGGSGFVANYQEINVDGGLKLKIAYGAKEIELPFSLYLNKFILERYPGSMSPSSFTSEVTLQDSRNSLKENHRIFMNNVLDYDGYRFFQSSYDPDEQGTILSVNHDFYGTWISYIGYFLLALGFLMTLFSKNSRFHLLGQNIKKIRAMRKAMMMLVAVMMGAATVSYAQGESHVSAAHADKFGHLVAQTFDGRFEPVNSLAYDVMHKISRKDVFEIDGVGKMDAMQVFEDMILNPNFWKQQKMIYIKEKSVKELLGVDGKYASFNDFFDEKSNYKLRDVAEKSFRKKQSEQNAFDKEIIKVDERANIFMMTLNGSMLKMFPSEHTMNNAWISWDDSLAYLPLNASFNILNEDLQLQKFNANSVMGLYLQEVFKATKTDDYSRAEKIMGHIQSIQRTGPTVSSLPSPSMINVEIQYNRSNIFVRLRDLYGMMAMVMLLLAFIDILSEKKNKVISLLLNVSIAVLACLFLYHTYGMILRWYLTGHAPWSTGYEALLLIGWASLLAGFTFVRNSKVTLAATTLLAFFVLMTASHSSYDPQLTNLQPVLKSYWLIIHVATLTISYGFLGLGFFLGLINMFIYLMKNKKNQERLDSITYELSSINEMNLTIGLFLATVGTFLGGIWANESWGKYWGWDAKETWALVIVITYSVVLHLRLVSKLKGEYFLNIGSILGFSSVLMTFIGVNYYLSKGLHSYAAGDTPIFPVWAWLCILAVFVLIIAAGMKRKSLRKDN